VFKKKQKIIKKILPIIYNIIGGFFIVGGWNWYHFPHSPHFSFVLASIVMWFIAIVGFEIFKIIYQKLVKKFGRIGFWQKDFFNSINELYFFFSLFFLVFFSRNQILSLVYFLFILLLFFWRFQVHLSRHPTAFLWLTVNRVVFLFTIFLFLINAFLQHLSFKYYILDGSYNYFNIVLFRSWAMTSFWLAGFAFSGFLYWTLKSFWRYMFFGFWTALFIFNLFVWAPNFASLYWTGYYFNPTIFSHVGSGVGQVFWNNITYLSSLAFLFLSILFIFVLKYVVRAHKLTPKRHWHYYNFTIFTIAIFSILGLSSFWTTPEYVISKSFYTYFTGGVVKEELSEVVLKKLEKFGFFYNIENYKVNEKEFIFEEYKNLLPEKFKNNPPNIFIVFFESFSARLTDVYNDEFEGITPGLKKMSENKNTTVFNNYFNASTPTITGLISQLCSFLPPTGHEEIQKENKFRAHNLLCLPEVLKKELGYKDIKYVTAVKKDFAHKDTIFASMGVDEIWGLDELANLTSDEPLSWGYSDHQLYPLVQDNFMKEEVEDPWLVMLSTVDNHPPYDLAKDMVYYEDGKNLVLNSVHTSDDAFLKFWEEFEKSKLKDNTIVIAVADHAIFPQAMNNKYFEEKHHALSFYDKNMFMMYVPDSVLPNIVDTRSNGLDFTPTLLHMFDVNIRNSFDGYSIFDKRQNIPSLLGMHEMGFNISEEVCEGEKCEFKETVGVIAGARCEEKDYTIDSSSPLTACEFIDFFNWKRKMLKEGRYWK